jgi:hypothetical protein
MVEKISSEPKTLVLLEIDDLIMSDLLGKRILNLDLETYEKTNLQQ